jgi:hypothetical protein
MGHQEHLEKDNQEKGADDAENDRFAIRWFHGVSRDPERGG